MDVKQKRYLLEILERELGPIRASHRVLPKIWDKSMICLEKGSEKARHAKLAKLFSEVKSAMGINYF